ncbi:MAG: hypothetical protein ACE5FU_03265 [Nitrospinota bacterium]
MSDNLPEPVYSTFLKNCGLAAAEFLEERFSMVSPIDRGLLGISTNKLQQGGADGLTCAWHFASVVFNKRDMGETMCLKKQGRDLQSLIKSVQQMCTNIRGWGFKTTFNPLVPGGEGLPLLVHGFSSAVYKDLTKPALGRVFKDYTIEGFPKPQGLTLCRAYGPVLKDPNSVTQFNPSCSLITSKCCPTATPVGYIVNAPVWNIHAIHSKDLQIKNDDSLQNTPLKLAMGYTPGKDQPSLKKGLRETSPQKIIQDTIKKAGFDKYNEIALLGTSLYNTTLKATGIFVKVKENGRLVETNPGFLRTDRMMRNMSFWETDDLMKQIQICAKSKSLPIVPIVDKSELAFPSDRTLDNLLTVTGGKLLTRQIA